MAIVFDIAGSVAMFRRPYTTTSSVSFPLPPPTTIAGLLAGIVGLNNGSHEEAYAARYWEELKETRIALSLINPIAWYTATVNFWNLKEPQKNPHIRVKHQFVKNPHYRIYVDGGLEKEVRRHLEAGTFIYTPCLGTAYALAEIQYQGAFDCCTVTQKSIRLSSVLPHPPEHNFQIDIIASKGVFRERLPFRLASNRALCESITTLYSASPEEKICLTAWEGLDVTYCGHDCIAWFPAWQ